MDTPAPDRDAEMLAALAEMDLSAARHVHAKLIAAAETDEVADMARAYGRVSRMLRQTLALKAKLARDAAEAQAPAWTPPWARPSAPQSAAAKAAHGFRIDDRMIELQAALDRVLHAQVPDDRPRRQALIERLDRELDDWTEEDDFLEVAFDAQVLRACRLLELPEDFAACWRDLPVPPRDPEDDDLGDEDFEDADVVGEDTPGFDAAPPPVTDTG